MSLSLWDLESATPCSTVRHLYVDLTEDLVCGMVLSQLCYWFKPNKSGKTKLGVSKHGRQWLARSREEWAAECRISPKQFDRALRVLEKLGIVQARVYRFNCKPMLHVWLDVPALTNLVMSHLTKGEIHSSQKGNSNLDLSGNPLTDTTAATTDSLEPAAVAAKVIQLPVGDQGQMKAKDILKHHQQAKSTSVGNTTLGLSLVWRQTMASQYEGYVKDLTAKERGQLKALLDKAQEQTQTLVRWSILNWHKFSNEVKLQHGLQIVPARPVVGFLLQHHDIGLQLIAKPTVPVGHESGALKSTPITAKKATEKVDKSLVESALDDLKAAKGSP